MALALDQIQKLVQEEGKIIIAAFDHDSKQTEAKIHEVGQDIQKLRHEMNHRFDEVDDKLQNLLNEVDIITDQKLEKFRQKYLTA